MTEQRKSSSKEQRKRFAFILSFTEENDLYKFKAICLITAKFSPLLSTLERHLSSLKFISRYQCRLFSMTQCALTELEKRDKSVNEVMKCRFPVISSPLIILFERTMPIVLIPSYSSLSMKSPISVERKYCLVSILPLLEKCSAARESISLYVLFSISTLNRDFKHYILFQKLFKVRFMTDFLVIEH